MPGLQRSQFNENSSIYDVVNYPTYKNSNKNIKKRILICSEIIRNI